MRIAMKTVKEQMDSAERIAATNRELELREQLSAEKARADKADATLEKMRKHIRCIYCDAEYTAPEQKEQLADHILSCVKSPIVNLCREYEGMLDMMVDEFIRIAALTDNTEIVGLCDRAMEKIKTAVPLIKERDELKDKLRLSETEVAQRIESMREMTAEIEALKSSKDKAEAACNELRSQSNCRINAMTAEVNRLLKSLDEHKAQRNRAEEACAEKDAALQWLWDDDEMGWYTGGQCFCDADDCVECAKCGRIASEKAKVEHEEDCPQGIIQRALSTTCGCGWISPEKAKMARDALERAKLRLPGAHTTLALVEQALVALKEEK